MNNSAQLDEWEEKLELKVQELQACQKTNNLDSCTPCSQFFECELRKKYVLAVYESMNKGSGGGFEF
jgi:hypothetical protein